MKPLEILKDFYFIERGLLNGNHFVYNSKEPVLIDTAYKTGYEDTISFIKETGACIEDVSLIINTHCHCDHIGGNKMIQGISGCNIAMHDIGRHFINMKDDWSTWWKYFNQEADFFNCSISLNDNGVINIGPYEFLVLHTPGHAADGVVLYNEKNRLLISSDTLWERDMAVMNLRVEGNNSLFEMRDSLKKISSLDVKIVYPGHGKPFTEFQKAIENTGERIRRFIFEPERVGNDLLNKIIVYTLMMKVEIPEEGFFDYLMNTYWFRETVDLYFDGQFESKYNEIIDRLMKRGILKLRNGLLSTTIKP